MLNPYNIDIPVHPYNMDMFYPKEEDNGKTSLHILDSLEGDNNIYIDSLIRCQPCQVFRN